MKRFAVLLLLFFSLVVVNAQDTVSEELPWYMFKPHGDFDDVREGNVFAGHQIHQYSGKDDRTVIVYGVALTMNYIPVNEERGTGSPVPSITPSVMLLHHEAYGNPPKVSFVDSTNVLGTMKQCFFKYQITNSAAVISPSYEYYFDTPHLFNSPDDTFYVSYYFPDNRMSNYNNWWRNVMGGNSAYEMSPINATLPMSATPLYMEYWYSNCSYGIFDFLPTIILETRNIHDAWGLIFPIVNLRCTAPYLDLVRYCDNTARVIWWQAEAGEAYQLTLTTYGGNPDTGLLVTPTDSFYTFTGLQPDTIYQVWARKACRYTTAGYDTLVWSDWGRPLTFRAAVGIGEVDDMALQVAVCDGCIAVQGLAADERAEVYDMLGRRVASLPSDGVTPPLPQGVYLLRTTAHSRARKVVLLR